MNSAGSCFILESTTDINLASVGGLKNTDYYYVIYEDHNLIEINEFNSANPKLYKSILIPGITPLTKKGTLIAYSNLLVIHVRDSSDYLMMVDYTKNDGKEIRGKFNLISPPSVMIGLNYFHYVALGYQTPSPGLDFRFGLINTRMWFDNINGNSPRIMDATPNDSFFVYVDSNNHIVLLKKNNPESTNICNYYLQVKSGTNCISCFNQEEFSSSSSLCSGNSNDGENRFVDFQFSDLNSNTEVAGKKRYHFKFQAIEYSNPGSGDGFSSYDLESNIKIELPSGYSTQMFNFIRDDVLYSGEFQLEFTPEIPEGQQLKLNFTLKNKLIGDGGNNDPVLFIHKIISLKLGEESSEKVENNIDETDEKNETEDSLLNDLLRNSATTNTAAAGKLLIISSGLSGGVLPLCGQFAFSMVKLFQIIEILAKLFFLPIIFSGKMDSILSAIAHLGDPIEVSPHILVSGELQDGYMNYKGKIFKFQEFANILQSTPFSTSFYMLSELVLLITSICIKT